MAHPEFRDRAYAARMPATTSSEVSPGARSATFAGPCFIVLNAGSGRQDAETRREIITRVFDAAGRRCEILPIDRSTPIERVATAAVARAKAERGAVIAAGGDGTINAVAQAAYGHGLPFGVIPLGTFNYFARVHGIAQDVEAATRALLRARIEPAQAGRAGGHLFLVNASLGLYPQLLEDREAFKQQFGRSRLVALWSGLVTLARQSRQLHLTIEAGDQKATLRTPTLVVVNNRLQLERLGFPEADALAQGQLAGIVIKPIGTLSMFGLLLRGVLGRLGDAENVQHLPFRRVTVSPRGRRRIKLAMDGEIRWVPTPVVFEVAPEPLSLLVPAPEDRVEVA